LNLLLSTTSAWWTCFPRSCLSTRRPGRPSRRSCPTTGSLRFCTAFQPLWALYKLTLNRLQRGCAEEGRIAMTLLQPWSRITARQQVTGARRRKRSAQCRRSYKIRDESDSPYDNTSTFSKFPRLFPHNPRKRSFQILRFPKLFYKNTKFPIYYIVLYTCNAKMMPLFNFVNCVPFRAVGVSWPAFMTLTTAAAAKTAMLLSQRRCCFHPKAAK
jgi:hypothetical protein